MNALKDWVHGSRERLTWLDCDSYVRVVFACGYQNWHDDPG
jgi:hypothetical protein